MNVAPLAGFPDFFLVGAPRCGTTSLAKWLRRHPRVCFSKPKEPHFFTRPTAELDAADLQRDYVDRFFPRRKPSHTIAGEGSVSYLYQPDAIRRILALRPDARFLVMLRDPKAMLASYHARMVFLLQEDERDVEKAWDLSEARARGERIPPRCLDPELLRYRDVVRHGEHLSNLLALVGRERCRVVVYDDYARDPRSTWIDVQKFLGIEDDGRTEFPSKQPTRDFRWRWLHALLYSPPRHLLKFVIAAEERERARPASPGRKKRKPWWKRARQRLIEWNTVVRSPAPLPPSLVARMRTELAPDVKRLEGILGRDLSRWL